MIKKINNWDGAGENILLISRVLVSINVQEPELTAMLDAYKDSVSARILGPRDHDDWGGGMTFGEHASMKDKS